MEIVYLFVLRKHIIQEDNIKDSRTVMIIAQLSQAMKPLLNFMKVVMLLSWNNFQIQGTW